MHLAVASLLEAVSDVSEQRHAESVIRAQEAELREVIDTIPAIVWSTLPDGSNTYVNKQFVEYCGFIGGTDGRIRVASANSP